MKIRRSLGAVLLAAVTSVVPLAVATAGPAHADRCEPEELVLGPNTSPVDERDSPACYVLLKYVYPYICTNRTTLLTCTQSISINPGYRPTLTISDYQPDAGRVICNIVLFVNSNGTCTFSANPLTGVVTVVTDGQTLVVPTAPATS